MTDFHIIIKNVNNRNNTPPYIPGAILYFSAILTTMAEIYKIASSIIDFYCLLCLFRYKALIYNELSVNNQLFILFILFIY